MAALGAAGPALLLKSTLSWDMEADKPQFWDPQAARGRDPKKWLLVFGLQGSGQSSWEEQEWGMWGGTGNVPKVWGSHGEHWGVLCSDQPLLGDARAQDCPKKGIFPRRKAKGNISLFLGGSRERHLLKSHLFLGGPGVNGNLSKPRREISG